MVVAKQAAKTTVKRTRIASRQQLGTIKKLFLTFLKPGGPRSIFLSFKVNGSTSCNYEIKKRFGAIFNLGTERKVVISA